MLLGGVGGVAEQMRRFHRARHRGIKPAQGPTETARASAPPAGQALPGADAWLASPANAGRISAGASASGRGRRRRPVVAGALASGRPELIVGPTDGRGFLGTFIGQSRRWTGTAESALRVNPAGAAAGSFGSHQEAQRVDLGRAPLDLRDAALASLFSFGAQQLRHCSPLGC